MRRVGNASNRRRRVVNIELPTATMTSHRVASADAPVTDGESIVGGNELSSDATAIDSKSMACSFKLSSLPRNERQAGNASNRRDESRT